MTLFKSGYGQSFLSLAWLLSCPGNDIPGKRNPKLIKLGTEFQRLTLSNGTQDLFGET